MTKHGIVNAYHHVRPYRHTGRVGAAGVFVPVIGVWMTRPTPVVRRPESMSTRTAVDMAPTKSKWSVVV